MHEQSLAEIGNWFNQNEQGYPETSVVQERSNGEKQHVDTYRLTFRVSLPRLPAVEVVPVFGG